MGDMTSPDSLRYPFDTDSPDIPRDFKNLADDVQAALLRVGKRFANATERDAYFVAQGGITEGQQVFLTDIGMYQGYINGIWFPVGGRMPYWFVDYRTGPQVPGGPWTDGCTGAPTTKSIFETSFLGTSGQIQVKYQGFYTVEAACGFAAVPDHTAAVGIGNLGGVTYQETFFEHVTGTTGLHTSWAVYLNAGDTLTAWIKSSVPAIHYHTMFKGLYLHAGFPLAEAHSGFPLLEAQTDVSQAKA